VESSTESLGDHALIRILSTLGEFVPREFIDDAASRGDAMEAELISIVRDDQYWEYDPADLRHWLPLHAIMILGLRTSERAGLALADALQICTRVGSELGDELGGLWPALLRNKPDSILPVFENLLRTRPDNEYCRIVSADVLTAAAQRRAPDALNAMLRQIADIVKDQSETLVFRQYMAMLLLSFPRAEFRTLVESLAGTRSDYGLMYAMLDVEIAFDEMKDAPEWERFSDPWEFYSEEATERRRERQREEDRNEPYDDAYVETIVRDSPKIGRNDPCPCGSGKKYKKCCLAKETEVAQSSDDLTWRRVRRVLGDFSHELPNFMLRTYGDTAVIEAWAAFMSDDQLPFDGRTPHAAVFYSWLFYRWSPDPHDTEVTDESLHHISPARAYLNRQGKRMDATLRRYVEAALFVPYTFYEVLSSDPGRGFRAREFFSGKECDVFEKSASAMMHPGDLFFGALVACDGIVLLEAVGAVSIPPVHKIELIRLREARALDTDISDDMLRALEMELIDNYLAIAESLLQPAMPELRNTDGDALAMQTLVFDIDSADQVFTALHDLDFKQTEQQQRAAATLDAAGHIKEAEITWMGVGNKVHSAWDNTSLGRVLISAKRLKVEVNSDVRAERIKGIVHARLGSAARYRVTERRSMPQMLEEFQNSPQAAQETKEQAELMQLPEIQEQLRKTLAAHYESWIDIALPALDGKTPLQAMRSSGGRERVAALVDDIERHSARQPGFDPAIIARLRERLGLL